MGDSIQDGMTITFGEPGQSLLAVAGEVDMSNADRLHDAIIEAATRADSEVEVDVSGVTFIDSTGLSALVRARSELEPRGIAIELRNSTPQVARILEITGLGPHFGVQ